MLIVHQQSHEHYYLVEYILRLEPSIGRVSTGKGEILLSVMLKDVRDAISGGDIEAGGKEVEVKNKGAVPMGQKAEFSVNSMETVYTDIEKEINLLKYGPAKARPAGRVQLVDTNPSKPNFTYGGKGLSPEEQILKLQDDLANEKGMLTYLQRASDRFKAAGAQKRELEKAAREAAEKEAKEAAEQELANKDASIDYAKASAQLAEAVARLKTIQKLRKNQ